MGKRQVPRKSAQRSVNNKLKDDGVFTVRSSSLTERNQGNNDQCRPSSQRRLNSLFCLSVSAPSHLIPTLFLEQSLPLSSLHISYCFGKTERPPPFSAVNHPRSLQMHSCMLDVSPPPCQRSSWQNISTSLSGKGTHMHRLLSCIQNLGLSFSPFSREYPSRHSTCTNDTCRARMMCMRALHSLFNGVTVE